MLNLPKSTDFNKRIPKQKFYEHLPITPALKVAFAQQIKAIYWRNKIAASTINIAPGKTVTELEVMEIQLNQPTIKENILRQIDNVIPYHLLFMLEYSGRYQAWIGYKEAAPANSKALSVNRYFHTDWLAEGEYQLQLEGLNMDVVYENYVRQIAGEQLLNVSADNLKEAIEKSERCRQLEKQIATLQTKIRKEKQLNRQMEMNDEVKRLKKELERLK